MHKAVAAFSSLSLILAASSASAATVTASLSQPAHVTLNTTASGCQNNPGPFITLDGELKLGGITARVILTNNQKFTHVGSQDITQDVVILPADQSIKIAKQPPQGGVGGNPFIYLRFNNCKGTSLSSATLLGRCVQGLSSSSLDFDLPTGAKLDVISSACSNNPGPFINLNGELGLGGLCARLILTNNAKFTLETSADVVVDVVLIPEGQKITFAKQPPLGGAGGNPLIYVQFLSGSGKELSIPLFIGRCNQIGG
jgi:hypothetical protein